MVALDVYENEYNMYIWVDDDPIIGDSDHLDHFVMDHWEIQPFPRCIYPFPHVFSIVWCLI